MAGKGMPPGTHQGVTAAGGYLQGHSPGPTGVAHTSSGLDGVTPMDIGRIAPCDERPAPQRAGKHLFGNFSD